MGSHMPSDQVKDILEALNIVDVISKYVPLTRKGKNHIGICPFHDDNHPSMCVSSEKQIFKCFTCGTGGNAIQFLQKYKNISYHDALKEAAELTGIEIKGESKNDIPYHLKRGYELNDEIVKYGSYNLLTEDGIKALTYLRSRDYTKEMIDHAKIGTVPDFNKLHHYLSRKGFSDDELINYDIMNINGYSKWQDRLLFPVTDSKGNIHGFTARTISQDKDIPKYINSSESELFHKGHLFYNFGNALESIRRNKEVILVEGAVDADRAGSIGLENCIAAMGTSLTSEHVKILKKMNVNIRLCYDGDRAGIEAAEKAYRSLRQVNIDPKITLLPDGEDPDTLIRKDTDRFRLLINEKDNFLDFKLKTMADLISFEDKETYVLAFLKDLHAYDNSFMEDHYIKELSSKTGFDRAVIKDRYLTLQGNDRLISATAKKNNRFAKSEITQNKQEKGTIIKINFREISKPIYKDEVHKKYDSPASIDSVLAYDGKKVLNRRDILQKYIQQKGKMLETVITIIDEEPSLIDYSAQAIASVAVAAIAQENMLEKSMMNYIAYLHKDTKYPHIHLQVWQEEPLLDRYRLTNHLIDVIKGSVDEVLRKDHPAEELAADPAPAISI